MYCSKCGSKVPRGTAICPECGQDLTYESTHIKGKDGRKKNASSSALAGVIVAALLTLAVVELVFLLGVLPSKVEKSAAGALSSEAASSSEAIADLIPTYAPDAVPAASPTPEAEPTPTFYVTPTPTPTETPTPTPTPEPTPTATPTPTPTPAPTPTPTPAPADLPSSQADKLPNSSDVSITTGDLDGMTAEEIRIARNEIYARHGLIFKSEDLQAYFGAQPWYQGTVSDATQIQLSEVERDNLETIMAYEKAHNMNQ